MVTTMTTPCETISKAAPCSFFNLDSLARKREMLQKEVEQKGWNAVWSISSIQKQKYGEIGDTTKYAIVSGYLAILEEKRLCPSSLQISPSSWGRFLERRSCDEHKE